MNATPEQLERSMRAYADNLTTIDAAALVAGAEDRSRRRHRTRAVAAVSGAAAVALGLTVTTTAVRARSADGQVAATPFPSGLSTARSVPPEVAARATELKVHQLGPGIQLAAVQEVELSPRSTTAVSVPKQVRTGFTATGTCRPSGGRKFTVEDNVSGFGGPAPIRCVDTSWPAKVTPLSTTGTRGPTLKLKNTSGRPMSVTVFYAVPIEWEDFPFDEYAVQSLDPAYEPVTQPGPAVATLKSAPSARQARTVTFSAPKHGHTAPRLEWAFKSESAGRFRILVNGQKVFCQGDLSTEIRASSCRDGLLTLWRSAERFPIMPSHDQTAIKPGDKVMVRVEPINARAPWRLEVREY